MSVDGTPGIEYLPPALADEITQDPALVAQLADEKTWQESLRCEIVEGGLAMFSGPPMSDEARQMAVDYIKFLQEDTKLKREAAEREVVDDK